MALAASSSSSAILRSVASHDLSGIFFVFSLFSFHYDGFYDLGFFFFFFQLSVEFVPTL